jgi:pilus assembly protein CpaB
MRSRALIFAILAIILAAITVIVSRGGHSGANVTAQAQEQAVPKTYVLVAAKDLPSGLLLHQDDLQWQAWPDEQINDAYLVKGKDDSQSLAGAVVRLHIAKGEPIGDSRVIKPGERGFLAAVLGPGMRATSAPLTAASDVAGLILPGDHVDLILTHPIKDERQPNAPARLVSETILTDLRVVAIDQIVNDTDKKPISGKTATFEVTPKQAEKIELAKMIGNLSLVLRSVANAPPDVDNPHPQPAESSHTWDSEVSPLIQHVEAGPPLPVSVVVLRGAGANAQQSAGAPAAAQPNIR